MAAISIKINNEIYIYMNVKLLMKKWLGHNSLVFDVRAYDKNTLISITRKNDKILHNIRK